MATSYDNYGRVVGTDPGSAAVYPGGVSSTSASGGSFVPQQVTFFMAAGAGGSADDVTLQSSNLPAKCYILDAVLMPTVGVSMATVTLRSAAAGGGTAYTSALAAGTAGTLSRTSTTVATAVAASTSLFARRSDSGVAGLVTVTFIPTV